MKRKNIIIEIGAIVICLLMFFNVTAIPHVQSSKVMRYIEKKENFINHITSDDFIKLLKEKYQYILTNIVLQKFWNTDYIQKYIYSDKFMNFIKTDELQYILSNLDFDNQKIIQTKQLLLVNEKQVSNIQSDAIVKGKEIFSLKNTKSIVQLDLFTALIILLIGIITWIPAIFLVLLSSPVYFVYGWIIFMLAFSMFVVPAWPYPIISAAMALIVSILYVAINCACWPVVWLFFLSWWAPPWI